MNLAFCYDQVLPTRGGCATYIADLARRLHADGHVVHLYASVWDDKALPAGLHYHRLPAPRGPRFLRPWRFGAACECAVREGGHDVSIGFDKTWGQDVLYPQGGLHSASACHNRLKYGDTWRGALSRLARRFDLAQWSFRALERRQYLGARRPLVVVNSDMVRGHFQQYLGIPQSELRVVRSAIDPIRFAEHDRPRRRLDARAAWGIRPHETVALFAAMNYRLKGLEPLLHAVQRLPASAPFRLLVVGHRRNGAYERLAKRLGVQERVCFAGHCADMRRGYFAADFLVHPTFYDPCSLVVLEALACGLPIITSRYNGASELLSPLREGFVIDDPHDHDRLARCIEQLLDPARRSACAQAARQTSTQWTFDHHYRQLLDVFAEAANRKQAA